MAEWLRAHVFVLTQSCPTLFHPVDWGLPGSSVHGIFQARILEQVAISYSKGWNLPLLCLLHGQADSIPLVPAGKSPVKG